MNIQSFPWCAVLLEFETLSNILSLFVCKKNISVITYFNLLMEFQYELRSNFFSLITVSIFEKKLSLTNIGFWKIFCYDQV